MQRITALKQIAFEKGGFEGYLVFNQSNLLYFTGASGTTALLIPCDGEGTIYVYSVNYEKAKAEAKGFRVERMDASDNLMAKISQQTHALGVKWLAFDGLSYDGWRSLRKESRGKMQLKPKPSFASQLRAVKDDGEIALMRKAAELTSLGMKTAYEVLSAGMKEYEVAAEIEYAMRKRGSGPTAFDTVVASGACSAFPHGGCSGREIRGGDLVVVDIGATFNHYCSDMTRTFVAGKPTEKQQSIYKIVENAQHQAFQTIKADVPVSEVDDIARRIIEDAGYGEFFVHRLGHGVGLEVHEPPTLHRSNKFVLSNGNVVTDEPGIYLPGYGGVRIEDTVLVQAHEAEKLTSGPYALKPGS